MTGASYAVRRDWPDGGHEYIGLRNNEAAALAGIQPDVRQWQRRHIRPTAHRVVAIAPTEFEIHRDRQHCHSPDCP